MSPVSIMMIAGHKHMDMLEHYTHPDIYYLLNDEFNKYLDNVHNYTKECIFSKEPSAMIS